MLDSEIEAKNRALVKKRKPLDEAVKDWERLWNEQKNIQWRKRWAKEIKNGGPMTFKEWLFNLRNGLMQGRENINLGWALDNFYEKQFEGLPLEGQARYMAINRNERPQWKSRLMKDLEQMENIYPRLALYGGEDVYFGIVNQTDYAFLNYEHSYFNDMAGYQDDDENRIMPFGFYFDLAKILGKAYRADIAGTPTKEQLRKGVHPEQDVWGVNDKGKKYARLTLNDRNWAILDLGVDDPARKGGLIYIGGRNRPEPKKYLRGHLYPETLIQEGWMPKKQLKTRKGKPYPPLGSAIRSDGSLNTYGPEYYI